MKKILFVLSLLTMILTLIINAHAATDKITVIVNGETVKFDIEPYIENNRTMVPIRFISEALGAKVDWNDTYKLVTITFNDIKIEQKIGKTVAIVNDQEVTFDVPAIINSGRTMVPVRFVSEALGANVEWNGTTRTVIITTKKAEIDPTPTPVNTAIPTVIEQYDPAKWVRVSENGEYTELTINIDWNIPDKFKANCDYAESVISKKYNAYIAKQVVDIARKKKDRRDSYVERLEYNNKKIDIESTDSVFILFWKEGVE